MIVVIFIVVIIFLITIFTHTEAKGQRGENEVVRRIERSIRKGFYGKILQNVYIPKAEGGTTEIDVLFISTKGIFVFEVKNYAGYIFGSGDRKEWTVTLYAGKNWYGGKKVEKLHFYNPIWQNRGHISNLNRILKNKIPLFSAIVFSDRGELKNVEYDPGDCEIMHTSSVIRYLESMHNYMADALTDDEIDSIYEKLLPYTKVTRQEQADHVNQILYQQRNMPKCPYCGSNLVIRTARSGPREGKQFYGCSNYPKCHYLKNID